MERKIFIQVAGKKYPLIISKRIDNDFTDLQEVIHLECKAAGINEEYFKSDLLDIIEKIPDLIYKNQIKESKNGVLNIRMTSKEKGKLELLAKQNGYSNVASYVRDKIFI